jgi:hypothetical protein
MEKGWELKIGSGLSAAFAFGMNFVLFGGQNYEEILMTWGGGGEGVFLKKEREFKFGKGCVKSSFGPKMPRWYPKPMLEINLYYV